MMTSGIQNSLSSACLPSIGRRSGGFVVGEVSGLECSLDVKFYYNNLLPSTYLVKWRRGGLWARVSIYLSVHMSTHPLPPIYTG